MKIHWKPQPKQALALASDADEILYGGSRGGGKTDAGQAWLLYDKDTPRYRALVIRRNADDLKDWTDRAEYMFRPSGATQAGNPSEFTFPSGAKVRTGHLKDENAYTKYQGHEYQKMVIEELSHIPREKDYLKLVASCRSTVDGIAPQVFCTTNPDDPGMEWIKERWDIPDEPDQNEVYVTYKKVEMVDPNTGQNVVRNRKLVFIPARLEDNPKLMLKDPGYLTFLESLKSSDINLYQAWRNGSWSGYGQEGSYYRDNLIQAEKAGRVQEGLYDPLLPVYTWCDLGVADAFSVGYFQHAHNQWRVIDYDEYEGASLGEVISAMNNKGYTYQTHFAPHDIEVRELGTGKSRLDIAFGLGVNYNIVPKLDVADGINALRMRFGVLWFDRTKTKELRKKLAKYHKEFDEKRGVWRDKPAHDANSHAADMMRYWATSDDLPSLEMLKQNLQSINQPAEDKYGLFAEF